MMARLTTFLKEQDLPRILQMTLEFDNGKTVEVQATKIEKLDLLQWIGPQESTLIADIRATFPADELDVDVGDSDG